MTTIRTGIGDKTPAEALEYIRSATVVEGPSFNVFLSMLRGLIRAGCPEAAEAAAHILRDKSYPRKIFNIAAEYARQNNGVVCIESVAA